MTDQRSSKRPLRADAVRNQARILIAAREVFSTRGLNVSLDDIADHAGLGIATLYRRFPDKESLIVAMFEQEMQKTVTLARAALAIPDPWEGLTAFLKAVFTAIANDKGLRQAFISSRYGLDAKASGRDELIKLLDILVRRAQAFGMLRPEITVHDIPPLMLMVGVVADFSFATNPRLWERYAMLLIDGLCTQSERRELTPGALSLAEMELATSSW